MPRSPATITQARDSADTVARLRRLSLAQQGLHKKQPFGRGKGATLAALGQLGYVQIDTISVVARAHHHVLRTRVANYAPKMLDALVAQQQVFEYWFHAAAYLPMDDYRFALPRMAEVRAGKRHLVGRRDKKMEREVLQRIAQEGPLAAKDFEGDGSRGGWWDWKPAKRALEVLFMQGELMVSERQGFQKRYDLRERVLPDNTDCRMPTDAEHAQHLLDHSLRNFAMVTVASASYLRRSAPLRKAMQSLIDERLATQSLTALQLPNGTKVYTDSEALERRAPTLAEQAHILSPFDNLVIQRDRTAALFNFDYLIECYVPESKRKYGYFCLPILYRDQFVGRMDCKAHRQQGLLEVKSLHLESGGQLPGGQDGPWLPAYAQALADYVAFNDCVRLKLPKTPTAASPRAVTSSGRAHSLAAPCARTLATAAHYPPPPSI